MVYSPYPEKTWNSNHLQMKFQRQHFLLSYFKILSVVPAGVRTRNLPHDSPMLNLLSHRCPVSIDIIKWSYDLRSYERNFYNCVEKPEKFRTSMGFEPVTSLFRCDANWAIKPLTLGAGHLWVPMVPWGMNQWWNGIWNESYMNCGYEIKWSYDLRIPHGTIRTHKWPAPNVSGFIAQLVRVSHRNCEVTGSNPVEVLKFSGFSNCRDHSFTWFHIRSSYMIHFIYHFIIDIIVGFWKQYPSTCKWEHTQVPKKLASAPLKPLPGTLGSPTQYSELG